MSASVEPEIGEWYKDEETQMSFEVIALESNDAGIEIQYFDGAVEALDGESWYQMALTRREPPEDWSGPYDDLEADDMGDTEEAKRPLNWRGPLDDLDK